MFPFVRVTFLTLISVNTIAVYNFSDLRTFDSDIKPIMRSSVLTRRSWTESVYFWNFLSSSWNPSLCISTVASLWVSLRMIVSSKWFWSNITLMLSVPLDNGRKLNVHNAFLRCPGHFPNALCTFNLRPVSMGGVLYPFL